MIFLADWTNVPGNVSDGIKAGEVWALALSEDGQYLASTTYDGRINVWDTVATEREKIRHYDTKGSFGMCIDLVRLSIFFPPHEGLVSVHIERGSWADVLASMISLPMDDSRLPAMRMVVCTSLITTQGECSIHYRVRINTSHSWVDMSI